MRGDGGKSCKIAIKSGNSNLSGFRESGEKMTGPFSGRGCCGPVFSWKKYQIDQLVTSISSHGYLQAAPVFSKPVVSRSC